MFIVLIQWRMKMYSLLLMRFVSMRTAAIVFLSSDEACLCKVNFRRIFDSTTNNRRSFDFCVVDVVATADSIVECNIKAYNTIYPLYIRIDGRLVFCYSHTNASNVADRQVISFSKWIHSIIRAVTTSSSCGDIQIPIWTIFKNESKKLFCFNIKWFNEIING